MKPFGMLRTEAPHRFMAGGRPCPCCTYVRREDKPRNKANRKRARRTEHTQVEDALFQMELDALGVERVKDLYDRDARQKAYDILYLYHVAHEEYDEHYNWELYESTYDEYESGTTCWRCHTYRDFCNCGYVSETDARWPALWVDGEVDDTHASRHDWDHEEFDFYDSWFDEFKYEGETAFFRDHNLPDVPGTEVLVQERQREKLKAGNRHYQMRKRS